MKDGWVKDEFYDCGTLIGHVAKLRWIWKPWIAIRRFPRYDSKYFWTKLSAEDFVTEYVYSIGR